MIQILQHAVYDSNDMSMPSFMQTLIATLIVKARGQERQNAMLDDMIWDVPRIIAELWLHDPQSGD